MPQVGETYVEVRADTSKVGKDIEQGVTEEVKKAEKAVGKFSDAWKKVELKGPAKAVQDFTSKAALPAGLALGAVAGAFGTMAHEAEQAEIAQKRLQSVMTSMGYPEATDRVAKFADELERNLAVDGELIKATQTKLATFANLTATVGEAGGAFDRATLAALDLAAAGFGSAETNAVQLGKALQDPVKGIGALARAGVTFTAQEKEKIKALVESGDVLSAQNLILNAIETQVGGTAEASKSSFEEIRLAFERAGESIGAVLLPMIAAVADAIGRFADFAENHRTTFIVLGSVIAGIAAAVLAVNTAMKVQIAIMTLANGIKAAYALITGTETAAVAAQTTATTAATAAQTGLNTAMALNPIGLIVVAIGALIAGFVLAYKKIDWFRNGVNKILNLVIGYFEFMVNAWIKVINAFTSGINKFTGLFSKVGIDIPKIGQIAEVTFGRIGDAANKAAASAADFRKAEEADMAAYRKNKKDATDDTTTFTTTVDKAGEAAKAAAQKVKSLRDEMGKGFESAMGAAAKVLESARKAFSDFAVDVGKAITSAFSFKDAYDTGKETGGGFLKALNEQAIKVQNFGVLVNRLIAAGISEQALQQVLAAGADAGSAIATELLSTADGVLRANGLVAQVQEVGNQVGLNAAGTFKQAGVTAGEALVAGINQVINNYKVKLKSKKLTAKQIARLQKQFEVDVEFAFEQAPALANGGVVSNPGMALIGEAGAEAVIPLTRPGRALDLMNQTGLTSLARSGGAAVNIENATFVEPIDAQLLAAKVMVAERARSFAQ